MGQRLRPGVPSHDASATAGAIGAPTIARARAGDDDAIHALYVRYAGVVGRYVFTLLLDRDAADDVTQTTFLKLLTSLELYEERDATFEAWLLRIARNAAFDELRKRRGFLAYDEEQTSAPIRVDDHLVHAIRSVPGPERRILVLRHLVGLSTRETAEKLALSEQTVRDMEQRGRGFLRPLVGKPDSNPLRQRGARSR